MKHEKGDGTSGAFPPMDECIKGTVTIQFRVTENLPAQVGTGDKYKEGNSGEPPANPSQTGDGADPMGLCLEFPVSISHHANSTYRPKSFLSLPFLTLGGCQDPELTGNLLTPGVSRRVCSDNGRICFLISPCYLENILWNSGATTLCWELGCVKRRYLMQLRSQACPSLYCRGEF